MPKILGQLETLLIDLRQREQRYGIQLEATTENVEGLDDSDAILTTTAIRSLQETARSHRNTLSEL